MAIGSKRAVAQISDMSADILVKLENLSIARSNHWLCKNLHYDLKRQHILWLCGRNGSGKTSLLQGIAGITQPTLGECIWLTRSRSYLGHALGIDLQVPVRDNLRFWSAVYQHPMTSDIWDLDPINHQPTSALSAGQRQRLALACHTPATVDVWLLDEPTSHLDRPAIEQLSHHLHHHLNRGGAAIIATHSLFCTWERHDVLALNV
jgi:heme exporter protein A